MRKNYNTFTEVLADYKEGLPYRYLLVYCMSSRHVGLTEQLADSINWEQVVEFRCFDEDGELHGFSGPEGICTVEITEKDAADDSILQYYPLIAAVDGGLGDTLMILRNIRYDEDGQGCIISSRCYGFTQRGGH